MELQKYFSESRCNLFHIHSTHYIAIESSCINVFVVSLAALLNSYLYLLQWMAKNQSIHLLEGHGSMSGSACGPRWGLPEKDTKTRLTDGERLSDKKLFWIEILFLKGIFKFSSILMVVHKALPCKGV